MQAVQQDEGANKKSAGELLHDYGRQIKIHVTWMERSRPGLSDRFPTLRSIAARPHPGLQPLAKWSKAAEELDAAATELETGWRV